MKKYVMALDAGTTSSRCILFDRSGRIRSLAQKEFTQFFPHPGWVEHDANEIWSTQLEVARQAMDNIGATAANIAAIGITNQRETTIVWDKKTGQPICRAIVWQCRRTSKYCDELKAKGLTESFRNKTGLVIDAYFSGTKLRWILENIPGARLREQLGELRLRLRNNAQLAVEDDGAAGCGALIEGDDVLFHRLPRFRKWPGEFVKTHRYQSVLRFHPPENCVII